jgi:signal transduction histidine kinase
MFLRHLPKVFHFFSILLIYILLISCSFQKNKLIEKGEIHLNSNLFKNNVKLNGDWDFNLNQLISNENYLSKNLESKYVRVPHIFHSNLIENFQYPINSYGTYHLKIIFDDEVYKEKLALSFKTMSCSSKIFWNDALLEEIGLVHEDPNLYQPKYKPMTITLPSEFLMKENHLFVQVACYDYVKVGLWAPVLIGFESNIIKDYYLGILKAWLPIPLILFFGIYQIVLYRIKSTEKYLLYFGIISFFVVVRLLFQQNFSIHLLFPDVSFFILKYFEHISIFGVSMFFNRFIMNFFPFNKSSRMLNWMDKSYIFLFILQSISPFIFYSYLLILFQYLTIVLLLRTIFDSIRYVLIKGKGSKLFLFLLTLIFVSNLLDIMSSWNLFYVESVGYYGFIIFIVLQSYRNIILTSEDYEDLVKLKAKQELIIEQRTDELFKEMKNLEKANMEIQKLAESRKRLSLIGEMVSGTVHDIKNPISAIKAYLELSMVIELEYSKRIEYINLSLREIDRLDDIILELLDFSKGKINLNLQYIDVRKFLNEIINFLKIDFFYSQIDLNLIVNKDTVIQIDLKRMRRVFFNLANNAREAMSDFKKKYHFTIRFDIDENFYNFSLEDNGPGISESIEVNIFEAFATHGKVNGNGLGLFMSRWIVEAHGGSLDYDSNLNIGTTFYIKIPKK